MTEVTKDQLKTLQQDLRKLDFKWMERLQDKLAENEPELIEVPAAIEDEKSFVRTKLYNVFSGQVKTPRIVIAVYKHATALLVDLKSQFQ